MFTSTDALIENVCLQRQRHKSLLLFEQSVNIFAILTRGITIKQKTYGPDGRYDIRTSLQFKSKLHSRMAITIYRPCRPCIAADPRGPGGPNAETLECNYSKLDQTRRASVDGYESACRDLETLTF